MINFLKALFAKAEKPDAPKARGCKHVRCVDHIGTWDIVYYGVDGRKVTRRNGVSFAELVRLRRMAAARGYRLI